MSVEAAWRELVAAAMVGTDRRAPEVPAVSGPVGAPLAATAGADTPAERLLDAAAVLTAYRRAGVAAVTGVPLPEPAPPEDRPEVPAAAAGRLANLLAGNRYGPSDAPGWARVDLLQEWLGHAAARDLRAPARHVPALLDIAATEVWPRSAVLAVGGRRAQWLVAQRPEWRSAIAASDELADHPEVWSEGDSDARLNYLYAVRDRDPDAARDLLVQSWATEKATNRRTFLGVLGTGLSAADEAFCERALTDRSGQVREQATELLGRLPGSQLGARMADRARPLVRYEAGRLAVTAPSQCDAGMRRDGVQPTPPEGTGERAWWLTQVIGRTPLSTWVNEFGLAPADIVALPENRQFTRAWRKGLVAAATEQRSPEWAAALVADPQTFAAPARGQYADDADGLFRALPPEQLHRYAVDMLRGRAPWRLPVLELCRMPWPDEVVTAAFESLAASEGDGARAWNRQIAQMAAARMPYHAAPPRSRSWFGNDTLIDVLSRVLRLRADLAKEFE